MTRGNNFVTVIASTTTQSFAVPERSSRHTGKLGFCFRKDFLLNREKKSTHLRVDRLTCQGDDILNRTLRAWDVRNDDERGHVLEIFYIPEINHLDNLRNFCSAPGANAILKEGGRSSWLKSGPKPSYLVALGFHSPNGHISHVVSVC